MSTQERQFATETRPYGIAAIADAARLITDGMPVAIPTETVYGLAARADSGEAVARIYAAKGRPSFNPLIVHVLGIDQAEKIADFSAVARRLARAFWPGPLTLVLPVKPGAPVAALATAGLATVALRAPAHPAMRALLERCALPLAAPSANASGSISPTRAAHVLASLGGRIPLIIDAGPTELGLESTIVAVTEGALTVLRPGPITDADLARATGLPVHAATADDAITAPGQLASHYAPSKPLRLNAVDHRPGEWLIGFGEIAGDVSLSPAGDLIEAAARLFDMLHHADSGVSAAIGVAPIPTDGLGVAINDRLARAAAPRD